MTINHKIGIVINKKMEKTVSVIVESKYKHKKYFKILVKLKKYLVHDEDNRCSIGDKILFKQCKPISKKKCWTLINIFTK
uniref:Small ribosomal subunit protein uS17c n=1 Tax=Nitzschia sp. IriIs04 TaxID=1444690 RepID=A0A0S3QPN2_9STRA|nr:ribosomal protein S17 [Nitzschia sp. IriIs04]BAT70302.1 ribosomal protein S17 [Nitzschia sp. IriIs04]